MTRRAAIIDVAVVGGMSIIYLIFEAFDVAKRWSFVTVGVGLGIYAVFLIRRRTHSLREMGLRRDNLSAGLVPIGLCTMLAGGGALLWALARGGAVWDSQVLLLLVLYPAWALVQQLGFQGLLHRGLMTLVPSSTVQVLLTAAAFACVHAGNRALVALTFAGGLMWSILYRRWPNLWLLTASHTILAALVYPLVLGDAPLTRV